MLNLKPPPIGVVWKLGEWRLTSLGNGTQSFPPSFIEMYLGLEVQRPGLRRSFLIGGLEGVRGLKEGGVNGGGKKSDVHPLGSTSLEVSAWTRGVGLSWKRVAINSGPKNPKDLLKKRRVSRHKRNFRFQHIRKSDA
ncbi:hypothetical protein TNCV_4562451 [Trichonephila clavipes]|nr:hypothetical protein TNCV_4562451 [Trichonephila clavipes]